MRRVSDIFHAEQNGGVGASLVEHLAGIQTHRALSDAGKLVLDLITLNLALLGNDFF